MTHTYVATTPLPVSKKEAFAYHERPGALGHLTPPWEPVTVEQSSGDLRVGSRVVLKISTMGIPLRWVAEHTQYDPPHLFADTQISGPFAKWDHRHEFASRAENESTLTDRITYELPFGPLGDICGRSMVRKKIETMFAYRHRVTRDDLATIVRYKLPMQSIAISGSGGLVGSRLNEFLTLAGHQTCSIVRSLGSPQEIAVWENDYEARKLNEVDTVIHLAGKSIADKRWTDSVKQEIRNSRVVKTRQLCDALASLERKPKLLVCASATGIYGDRGEEWLDEQSSHGDDFLAHVGSEWEEACESAVAAGIRVVHARFGIILSAGGGALEKMLLPAKALGGRLGSGEQWWSWIALDDVVGAIYHVMATESISGPVNFVSPDPIRNCDFAKTLGRVIHRPAIFPAPKFGLRLVLGEMADALLLSSTRVIPKVLNESGYSFRFVDLTDALRYSLGRERLPTSSPP